jgi:hypothetical protein
VQVVAVKEAAAARRRNLIVVGASGLPKVDLWGGCDPYAVVWWLGEQVGQTEVMDNSLDPQWGETFTIQVPPAGGELRVELFDQDDGNDDDFLGMLTLSVGGGEDGVAVEGGPEAVFATKTWQLLNRDGGMLGVKGRLSLRLEEEGDAFAMEMRSLFREIDEDGSGTLDADEIRQLVARLGRRLSDKELHAAMREMDESGDGEVDFEEFEQCASLPADDLVMHHRDARQGR